MLTQDGFIGIGFLIAAQTRQEHIRVFHTGMAQGIFKGGQHIALDDVQQDVITGHAEAVTETLFGRDGQVAATARPCRATQGVVTDHDIGGTAANINNAQRQCFPIFLVGSGNRIKELVSMASEVLGNFGKQVDQLRAGSLVPFHPELGQRYAQVLRHAARFRRLQTIRVFFALIPVHAGPQQTNGLTQTLGQQAAFYQRHAGRHGQNNIAQAARLVGVTLAYPLGRAIDLQQRLGQHLSQHESHDRAARIERLEHRQTVVFVQGVQGFTTLIDVQGERCRQGTRFCIGAVVLLAETPAVLVFVFVPQVTLGAGQPGRALGAATAGSQARGLIPDTH